jgi:hypothetical protein
MTKNKFEPEDPQTRWLSTGKAPNRDMSLQEDFVYWDREGTRWAAPVGSEVDGASIPQALWSIVGSPFTGCYRRASILHDVACDNAKNDFPARREADRMYYYACRKGGCSIPEAIVQYLGVTIGAWASRIKHFEIYDREVVVEALTDGERRQREITDAVIVGTFNELKLGVQQYMTRAESVELAEEDSLFENVRAEVDRQLDIKTKQLSAIL